MKNFAAAFILAAALLLPQTALCATDMQAPVEKLLSQMDLSAWQQQVPELQLRQLIERCSKGDFSIDEKELFRYAADAALSELSFSLPLLLRACAVSLLMSVLCRMRLSNLSEETSKISELVLFLCAALPLAADFMRMVNKGGECILSLNSVAQILLPTMLALLASIGSSATTVAMQPLLLSAAALVTQVMQSVLLPVIKVMCMLTLVSCMEREKRLSSLTNCLRSFSHWTLGLSFTVFLGLLAAKGMGSGTFDTVMVRTAKYTVDNLVPVVGGLFKDSVETLAGCALIVKNAVGLAGLASLLACLLRPACSVFAVLCGYRICAALLQPLGENLLTDALGGFASAMQTLLLCLLVTLAVFFVFVAVLMQSGIQF